MDWYMCDERLVSGRNNAVGFAINIKCWYGKNTGLGLNGWRDQIGKSSSMG